MRKLLAAAFPALLLVFTQGANAEPLGIGEIKMGMSIADVFKSEDVVCRSRGMIYKYTICNKSISIRSKPVETDFYFDSDALVMILLKLDPVNCGAVKDELKEKWGEPSLQDVKTNNFAMEWDLPEGQITLSYDGKNTNSANIMSSEGIKKYRENMKKYLPE